MNLDRPNIDRPMVSLFFEIKRNMPYDQREHMKISSPNIGQQLISIYRKSGSAPLKQLIEDFMERAGDDWTDKLSPSNKKQSTFYSWPNYHTYKRCLKTKNEAQHLGAPRRLRVNKILDWTFRAYASTLAQRLFRVANWCRWIQRLINFIFASTELQMP